MPDIPPPDLARERKLIVVVAAVQFVNVLDFVMVMPMGPDFAIALGIDLTHLGAIGGAYTAAAAVSGLLASAFLDRFDRRTALAWGMVGLGIGTLAGGFAWDLRSLIAARVLAGAFGGPATAVAMAIVADAVPPARRGRAMGAVMGSFSIASVVGVPAGLALAQHLGWRWPFLVIGGACLAVAALARAQLPQLRDHVARASAEAASVRDAVGILGRREFWLSYAMGATAALSSFLLIPNLSAYTQYNLGLPRGDLGLLYLYGGLASLVAMWSAGRAVDRLGALSVLNLTVVVFFGVLWTGFWHWTGAVSAIAVFVPYFVANAARNVAFNATASKVPAAHERARFMSAMSAVQHIGAATGALVSGLMLVERADHRLAGMGAVAMASFAASLLLPVWLALVERQLRRAPA
ncbi:MAG: MFS transporter [Deltaproteobacteria bacterium]|nr:MFS transporter [Deltaproteobacteria bacterium]